MKLTAVAFTGGGLRLMKRLEPVLLKLGHETRLYSKSKYIEEEPEEKVVQIEEKLSSWAEQVLPFSDGLVFIGAVGIAVRTIAPYVKSKQTDPAVVVLDEKGQFVIPLLSGHLGGANELASQIAEAIGGIAVITTATDVNRKFAVDVFAKKNHLYISDMRLAKEVSARILAGETLTFGAGSGFKLPQKTEWKGAIDDCPDRKRGTFWIALPGEHGEEYLHLIPKKVVLGIGCRRGTPAEKIEKLAAKVLRENGIFPQAVSQAATIDLKKDEEGLREFCSRWELPLNVYTAEELKRAPGNFTSSAFVQQITGVDNVCERSACLALHQGTLLVRKQAQDGVTIACGIREWSVDFE